GGPFDLLLRPRQPPLRTSYRHLGRADESLRRRHRGSLIAMPAAPIRIDDPDDPRVAAYHSIRERDLAGREGLFVAEGQAVLGVLFRERRFQVESALVLESRHAGTAETLALAPRDTPVYVASQAVMDRIAGFHIHRGVLALGRRRPAEDIASLLSNLP